MAGTLYRCAAPGEPPFIKEGDIVKKGQTVCIIEAMKLMNEIEVGGRMGPRKQRCWQRGAALNAMRGFFFERMRCALMMASYTTV